MTDSVRSWQAQTHSPWTSCPATHTYAFCLLRKRRKWWTREEPRPWGDTPVSTRLLAPSSHQCPTSQRHAANHAYATNYTTQWTTAVCDHMEREEPTARVTSWDIRYLCWPEKQKRGFEDYSGGKDNKETETLADKWMTAERVAGQRQGKPCGLLNCIPLRLWQCDDARDDEDNK